MASDASPPLEHEREVVVVNERSGTGTGPDLPDWLADASIVAADEIETVLSAAVANGQVERVIVWGGDGTTRAVAKTLVGSDTALLPAPAGTHNHFAQHLGITDLDELEAARKANVVKSLDVGYVNDEVFLNNANVGWYVELVRRRERYERRVPRRVAKIVSTLVQMARTHRVALDVDGEPVVAWMVWIGNGRFALDPTRLAERDELCDGVLDVRVLPARRPLPRARVMLALLRHDVDDHPSLRRWTTTAVELRPRGGGHRRMRVACDGEVVRLMSPLRFRAEPGVLRTVVGAERA